VRFLCHHEAELHFTSFHRIPLGLHLGLFSCGNRTTCTSASQGIYLGPLLGHPLLCRRFFRISIVVVITLNGSSLIGSSTSTRHITGRSSGSIQGLPLSPPISSPIPIPCNMACLHGRSLAPLSIATTRGILFSSRHAIKSEIYAITRQNFISSHYISFHRIPLGLQLGLFSCGNRTTCTSASQGIHLGPLLGHPFLCRRFFHINIVLVITLNGSFPIGISHTDTCAIASDIIVDAAGLTVSVPACC